MKNLRSRIYLPVLVTIIVSLALATSARAQYVETTLYNFTFGNDGGSPNSLIVDSAGNFYGTAAGGPITTACPFSCGVVFKLSKTGGRWIESVLYSFTNGSDGANPSGIVMDAYGNIYGLSQGAANYGQGDGVAFKLSFHSGGGWRFSLIHKFGSVSGDGVTPVGSPILDAAGNLYGATYIGGSSTNCTDGCGTVFELSPTAGGLWTETILHNFTGGTTDGWLPQAGVTFDSTGNLFGTTGAGGNADGGTIFELSPVSSSWSYNLIYNFQGPPTDGWSARAPLLIDSADNLYGTTYNGGRFNVSGCYQYCGMAFELKPVSGGGWAETVLHNFNYTTDGALPDAGFITDGSGHLYGTTNTGAPGGRGTVYKLSPDSAGMWRDTVLYVFYGGTGSGGTSPVAGVLLDASGNLYGAATGSGLYNGGTIYKLSPPTTDSSVK